MPFCKTVLPFEPTNYLAKILDKAAAQLKGV